MSRVFFSHSGALEIELEFRFLPEEEAFRDELRRFLAASRVASRLEGSRTTASKMSDGEFAFSQEFARRLGRRGWLTIWRGRAPSAAPMRALWRNSFTTRKWRTRERRLDSPLDRIWVWANPDDLGYRCAAVTAPPCDCHQ